MKSEIDRLIQIKTIVYGLFPHSEVILFGSRARGENRINSDYDLLIILNSPLDQKQRLHNQALIRKSLASHHILADIIVHSSTDIEKKRNLPGHIVKSALIEGVRI